MAPEYNLSPEEQQDFAERLKEIGLDASHVVAELITGSTSGATILSDDPEIESAIQPVMLVVHSLDEAKRLVGNADALLGNGDVVDPHAPLPAWSIEKHYFPLKVGAFAIQNVTVSAGHPLILDGSNQVYNFGVVTIEAGGEIHITADHVTMTCQKIISNTDEA